MYTYKSGVISVDINGNLKNEKVSQFFVKRAYFLRIDSISISKDTINPDLRILTDMKSLPFSNTRKSPVGIV